MSEEVALNSEIRKTMADIQTAFEQFKSANDQRILETKKQFEDVCTIEKVNKINEELTKKQEVLEKEILELKRAKIISKMDDVDALPSAAETYKKSFAGYLKRGSFFIHDHELKSLEIAALNSMPEMKSLSTNDDGSGGYTVLPYMDTAIRQLQVVLSPMRNVSQVVSTGNASYQFIVDMNNANSGWVGEVDARPETNTPNLKQVEVPMNEIYANPASTQTMLDDSFLNVEQWLAQSVATAFASTEGTAFISGDGVKKPRGLLTFPVVADASWSWGNVGYVPTGAAGAFTAQSAAAGTGADVLNNLVATLKPKYRANASWLMNRKTIAAVRNIKSTQGEYLWQPSVVAGNPNTLLNYPLVEMEGIPDIAASSLSIAFGDFRQAYLIVDRMGVRVLRDVYTNKPYVSFYTTKRLSGTVQNFEAFKLLRFSVS